MNRSDNLYNNTNIVLPEDKHVDGKTGWTSPSNIALVKYWGKHGNQLPMNPSISFTLNASLTQTSIIYHSQFSGDLKVQFFFDGKEEPAFLPKLDNFFGKLQHIFPFLGQLNIEIHTRNTFPHSAGIASSASAMSALALCLCDIEDQLFHTLSDEQEFFRKASFVARLGSGSAARSLYGGLVNWGESGHLNGSSNHHGTQINKIDPVFQSYCDTILIVSSAQKKVSSTVGHGLMNNHPFARPRFEQAARNHTELIKVLETGNVDRFVEIVEEEALSLHSMMLTSLPGFILMEPETLRGIELIRDYRRSSGIRVCFTLDAGPNIHLLYPEADKVEVEKFIVGNFNELIEKKNVIYDRVGKGPQRLN
jgi:diphosphomevalonate decarboxylase